MSANMNNEQRPLNSGFGAQTTAAEIVANANLAGQTIVITGGYAGIGLETTKQLTRAKANVIVGARDLEKARNALAGLAGVQILLLDLSKPESIDDFANLVTRTNAPLNLLINNAGIMATPLARDARGFEMQFATNHLGHFQLTNRLWPLLTKAKRARVITLTSAGHRFGAVNFEDPNFNTRPYEKWAAYGQSKSANSLFAVELDRRGKDAGIRAFAVHPGRIFETDLSRHMTLEERQKMLDAAKAQNPSAAAYPTKTIEQGAATTLWCALSPQLAKIGGVYCEDCDVSKLVADDADLPPGVKSWAIDQELAKKLWTLSEQLLG